MTQTYCYQICVENSMALRQHVNSISILSDGIFKIKYGRITFEVLSSNPLEFNELRDLAIKKLWEGWFLKQGYDNNHFIKKTVFEIEITYDIVIIDEINDQNNNTGQLEIDFSNGN